MGFRGVFVTGTDTGVGKTVVSAVLARAWDADYWKPVQTGLDEDAGDTAAVATLAGLGPDRLHPPRHALKLPLSPDAAAAAEGVNIALDDFALPDAERPLVVEGAGGLLVPLCEGAQVIDLIARLGLPTVVVAADRLGAINHTLLTLEALRARGLPIFGVALVGGRFADNAATIERHGGARIVLRLPRRDPPDPAAIAAWARLAPAPHLD